MYPSNQDDEWVIQRWGAATIDSILAYKFSCPMFDTWHFTIFLRIFFVVAEVNQLQCCLESRLQRPITVDWNHLVLTSGSYYKSTTKWIIINSHICCYYARVILTRMVYTRNVVDKNKLLQSRSIIDMSATSGGAWLTYISVVRSQNVILSKAADQGIKPLKILLRKIRL